MRFVQTFSVRILAACVALVLSMGSVCAVEVSLFKVGGDAVEPLASGTTELQSGLLTLSLSAATVSPTAFDVTLRVTTTATYGTDYTILYDTVSSPAVTHTTVTGVDFFTVTVPSGETSVDLKVKPLFNTGFNGSRTLIIAISDPGVDLQGSTNPTTGAPISAPNTIGANASVTQVVREAVFTVSGVSGHALVIESPAQSALVRFTCDVDLQQDLTLDSFLTWTGGTSTTITAPSVVMLSGTSSIDAVITPAAVNTTIGIGNILVSMARGAGNFSVLSGFSSARVFVIGAKPSTIYEVNVKTMQAARIAYERGSVPAVFRVIRSGATGALSAIVTLGGGATYSTDYTVVAKTSANAALPSGSSVTIDTTTGGAILLVTFGEGIAEIDLQIVPVDDGVTESLESVTALLLPMPDIYNIGSNTADFVQITDGSVTASVVMPKAQVREVFSDTAVSAHGVFRFNLSSNPDSNGSAVNFLASDDSTTSAFSVVMMLVKTQISDDQVAVMNRRTFGWELAADAPEGSTQVTVKTKGTAFGSFAVDDAFFIGGSNNPYLITSMTGLTLTLNVGLDADAAKGTKVNNNITYSLDALGRFSAPIPQYYAGLEIGIVPTDNDIAEGSRHVSLSAIQVSNLFTLVNPSQQTLVIADDDTLVGLTAVADATSGVSNGSLTATLVTAATKDITVDLEVDETSSTTNYSTFFETIPTSIVIPAGQLSAKATIVAKSTNTNTAHILLRIKNSDEYLPYSSPAAGFEVSRVVNAQLSVGRVWLSVSPSSQVEAIGQTITYTAHIDRTAGVSAAQGVSINFDLDGSVATEGADFQTVSSKTIEIAANALTGTKVVTIVPDTLAEGNEQLIVTLRSGQGYELYPQNLSDSSTKPISLASTILDNAPTVSISTASSSILESSSARFTVSYTLAAGGNLGDAVRVYLGFNPDIPNSDYTITGASQDTTLNKWYVEISAANNSTTVTVVPANNVTIEGDRTVTLSVVTDPRTPDEYLLATSSTSATITVTDANAPGTDKPAPGDESSDVSSGGCGLGSGLAGVLGAMVLALRMAMRQRLRN